MGALVAGCRNEGTELARRTVVTSGYVRWTVEAALEDPEGRVGDCFGMST